jgi:FMN reductase
VTIVVLGLGGSTRPDSNTERALRVSLAAAENEGAQTELLAGGDLLLPPYEPDVLNRTEEARILVERVRHADGLLVASPGYHGLLSGLVKNALDYLEDLRDDPRPYLDGRAVGLIATATGWQATVSTLMSLRAAVHALRGWPTPMGAAINTAGGAFDDRGECNDPAARFQLELVGRQVVEFARMRAALAVEP